MTRLPPRLIGREPELDRLVAALDAAASGRPAFILLVGEAGIGKSALLAASAQRAADRTMRVLAGSAVETGATIPYLPLMGPLASAITDRDADAASAIVRHVVRGESMRARGSSSAESDLAAGAARFIEAIFDVLVRRPTLLIVDDVHWADRSTQTVLDYLSRRASDVPLAVVAAARDDEPDSIARLPIADGRHFTQIALRRLDRSEVADQAAGLLGRRPADDVVQRLFERSAGNPMFVEELLNAGTAVGSPAATASASAALRGLVLGRVGRLGEAARAAVEALAIIGRPADERLVAAVAGLAPDAAGPALDEAVRGGVAATRGRLHDVRHPIVGEVVAASIPASASRSLHRRAAEALESAIPPAPGSAGERTRHWFAAGEDRRAWSASLDAADEAERSFAFAEAHAALDRAVGTWPAGAPGLAEARLRAADRAWMAGDPAAALDLARQVDAMPDRPAAIELEMHIAIGRYAWDAGERAASAPAFARAAERLDEQTPPEVRARALWGVGRGFVGVGSFQEAYEKGVEAARAAAEANSTAWEGEAWLLAGMSKGFAGEFALDELRRGLELALEAGDPGCAGHGYQFNVDILGLAGDRTESLRVALEGIEACDRLGVASVHGSDVRGQAAHLLIDEGRWADAEEVLRPADPRAIASLARALLAMRRGETDAAGEALAATAVGGSIGGPGMRGGPLECARAELAWLRGDVGEARRAVATVVLVPGVWGDDGAAWRAFWEARLRVERTIEPRPRHPDTALDRALGAEIAAERSPGEAAWADAAEAWSSIHRPYDEGWARLRHAEAGFAGGDREAARRALHEATRIAEELGAVPLLRRAEDLARRARVSARPARRATPDPTQLTDRERDVLALLAEGRTDRQIAEALFLSPKTVGIHVSRILGKLGASTRGEAVAAARRKGQLDR